MELGATHAFATAEEAQGAITEMTRGQGADSAILTVDLMTAEVVEAGFNAIGKGGIVVITGLNKLELPTVQLSGSVMTLFRKTVKGSLFGDCNPTTDIPKILGLYQALATSSSTRSSPGPTPWTRSTRATTTCWPARTCAAS